MLLHISPTTLTQTVSQELELSPWGTIYRVFLEDSQRSDNALLSLRRLVLRYAPRNSPTILHEFPRALHLVQSSHHMDVKCELYKTTAQPDPTYQSFIVTCMDPPSTLWEISGCNRGETLSRHFSLDFLALLHLITPLFQLLVSILLMRDHTASGMYWHAFLFCSVRRINTLRVCP